MKDVNMSSKLRTKKAKLIALLGAKVPKSLDQLGAILGWQKHTVSAAITRLKHNGHEIVSIKSGQGARTYAIYASKLAKVAQ